MIDGINNDADDRIVSCCAEGKFTTFLTRMGREKRTSKARDAHQGRSLKGLIRGGNGDDVSGAKKVKIRAIKAFEHYCGLFSPFTLISMGFAGFPRAHAAPQFYYGLFSAVLGFTFVRIFADQVVEPN